MRYGYRPPYYPKVGQIDAAILPGPARQAAQMYIPQGEPQFPPPKGEEGNPNRPAIPQLHESQRRLIEAVWNNKIALLGLISVWSSAMRDVQNIPTYLFGRAREEMIQRARTLPGSIPGYPGI